MPGQLENHCYRGYGTLEPDANVRRMFLAETADIGGDLPAGAFVVWERITGRVFVKVSSGGSWSSGPTITRGAELNVENRKVLEMPQLVKGGTATSWPFGFSS